MERLLLLAVISALAVAKPELYREKEDFQYSRSSSDEGSKSGFYGAQRGNMGGNFERAHNMDGLAQHQMGGLVKQVQGELGEGRKTRTGSVFTAANSKGVYGSGNYDLSNLEGRNFQEGVSFDDSQSQSSLSSHAGYNTQSSALSNGGTYSASDSQSSRYHSGYNGYSGQSSTNSGHTYDSSGRSQGYTGQVENTQELDSTRGVKRYDYGGQEASGYYSQSGSHRQSSYDHSNTNSHSSDYAVNTQSRQITAMPVRVIIRPGTKVHVPIATQSLNTAQTGAAYDQSSVNSEAEILNNQNQPNIYKPTGQAKHYESAYSYHKEWEKHDTKPTENPLPKNSELYEDSQAHLSGQQYDSTAIDSQNSHLSNAYSGFNTNAHSTSSNQHRYQFKSNEQQNKAVSSSNSNTNTYAGYNSGLNADVNNQIEYTDNKPKSYQSSYSYHKSWERQGDPYVIKPVGGVNDAQESQKLTAAAGNLGTWSSHQYGSRFQKNRHYLNTEDCDCEEDSHIREPRSYNSNQHQQRIYYNGEETGQEAENLGQQAQNKLENLEDLGQQTQNKWDKLEKIGQQSENQWSNLETLGQQTQNQWDKVENAGQQIQNKWDQLEDLNQQNQNQWNSFGEQTRPENVEQEAQNSWIVRPHSTVQPDAIQQTQNTWLTQSELPVKHNLNQPIQNTRPDQSEIPLTFNQQTHNTWRSNHNLQTQSNGIGHADVPFFNHFNYASQPDNSFYSQFGNTKPWYHEHHHSQFNQHSQTYDNNWNFYEHSHRQYDWPKEDRFKLTENNFNNQNPQSTPTLSKLWDKIDTIEKQFSSNNDGQPSLTDTETQYVDTNLYPTEYFSRKPYGSPNIDHSISSEEQTRTDNILATNIGRGDIGPEEEVNQTIILTEKILKEPKPIYKPDKTTAEIELLSQTLDTNKIQNPRQQSPTLKPQNTEEQFETIPQQSSALERQNTEQQFETIPQQSTALEQQFETIPQQSSTLDQQNTEQQFETIPQQSSTLEQQNTEQQFETIPQQSSTLEQQKTEQQFETIPQQSSALEQQFETIPQQSSILDQQNTEQQFETVPQQSSTLEQQKTEQQFESIPQQSSPLEQQFESIPQQSSTLEQQNTEQQFETIPQQSSALDQQNTEQQFETIPQQSLTLEQQKTEQQFESIPQQSSPLEQQNTEQQFESIPQQSSALEQQNTEQQFETIPQQSSSWEQQNTEQRFDLFKQQNIEKLDNLNPQYSEQQFGRSNNERYGNNHQPVQTATKIDDLNVVPLHELKNENEENYDNKYSQNDNEQSLKNENSSITSTEIPLEVTTERSGFWKNIGNKFSSAKDSVISWFHGS